MERIKKSVRSVNQDIVKRQKFGFGDHLGCLTLTMKALRSFETRYYSPSGI